MTSQKFKQTEIGKAISINPKRELKKGTLSKKISMDKLDPFNKKIKGFEVSKYNGGSKFTDGDVLLARITPCLENGKTAYVDFLKKGEVGFGSTEFIVLSEKEGETTKEFVYYLAISPRFREQAISSMTGTSGRQRVQTDFLEVKEIEIPPLPEQHAIASILSSLDEKIELNNKMNKTLEAIGQALFKKWFVEERKEEQKEGKLGEIVANIKIPLKPGEEIKNRKYVPIDLLSMNKISIDSFLPYTEAKSSLIGFEKEDILFGAMRVYFHRVNLAPFSGVTRTTTFVLRPKNKEHLAYCLFLLNQEETINFANSHSKGSTMPYAVWNNSLENMPIKIPDDRTIKNFNKIIKPIFEQISVNCFQNKNLSSIRDALLPKLMSGEIRVK